MNRSTCSLEEHPVKASPSQEMDLDWMTRVLALPVSFAELSKSTVLDGLSGRTCPVASALIKGPTSLSSCGRLQKSGMAFAGECWTLNFSVYPNTVKECSLSQVLEHINRPSRFFLSDRAIQGILDRAKRRNKKLPEAFLQAVSAMTSR